MVDASCSWIKCNTNETSRGNYGLSTIGATLRDCSGTIADCFSDYLDVATSFHVEFFLLCMLLRSSTLNVSFDFGWSVILCWWFNVSLILILFFGSWILYCWIVYPLQDKFSSISLLFIWKATCMLNILLMLIFTLVILLGRIYILVIFGMTLITIDTIFPFIILVNASLKFVLVHHDVYFVTLLLLGLLLFIMIFTLLYYSFFHSPLFNPMISR